MSHQRPRRAAPPARKSAVERPPRPLKPQEQYLLDAVPEMSGERLVFASSGGAHAAAEAARRHPQSTVICNFFDIFLADSARKRQAEVPGLIITCEPDFADVPTDVFALPLTAGSESELARDQIQTAHQRLKPDGRLFVSIDNPKDHWVHEHLKELFARVTNRPLKKGRLYIGSAPLPLKKVKDHLCWFAFRDNGRLIHCCSRPGVFSHRRLDLGARALMESLSVEDGPHREDVIQPGFRVLDVGAGCGAVGFAAAFRAENVTVHALDASSRALQCTRLGAERNELARITTQLEAEGRVEEPGTWDVVLANPPYFSDFKIGDIFITAALNALRPGGRTHFVTKAPEWYTERFAEEFDQVSVREVRGYFIVKGTQKKKRRSQS